MKKVILSVITTIMVLMMIPFAEAAERSSSAAKNKGV